MVMEDNNLVADHETDFDESLREDCNMGEDCGNSKGNHFDCKHISTDHSLALKKRVRADRSSSNRRSRNDAVRAEF